MWELIFDPIRSASAIARERHNSYISTYRSILKSIQHQIDKTGTIDAPELQDNQGRIYRFGQRDGRGMAELIGFLQHAGSESNLNAVLSTYGFTMEQFEKFLNRIQENGTVNKETFVAIQRIWNLNDSLLPDAARAYRERTNVAMNPVKRRTLKTKFGDFEGGYVPLMTDRDYQAALRDPAELSLAARGGKFINTMASSVFPTWGIDRVENRKDRPVMDVRINIAHAAQVINFIHIEPVVVNAAKILSRDEGNRVAAALDRYNPKIIDEILAPWLQRVLHQRTSQRGSLGDATDDMLSEIRRNASAGIMFANVINSLQNVTGLVVATTDVKIGYLAAALKDLASNRKNTIDMVASMAGKITGEWKAGDMAGKWLAIQEAAEAPAAASSAPAAGSLEGTYQTTIVADGQGEFSFSMVIANQDGTLKTSVPEGGDLNIVEIEVKDPDVVNLTATYQGQGPIPLTGKRVGTDEMAGKWEAGGFSGTWKAVRKK